MRALDSWGGMGKASLRSGMLLHRNRKIQRATWAVGVWGRILYRLSEVKVMKNVDRNFDYSASKAKLSFGLNSVGNTEPLGLVCNRSKEVSMRWGK